LEEGGAMAKLSLSIDHNATLDTNLQLLSFLPAMGNVEELAVRLHHKWSEEASRALGAILDAVSRSAVTRLSLFHNGMDDVSGSFQTALPLSKLTELDFSFNGLSAPGARSLMTGLASCPTMRKLVLKRDVPFLPEVVRAVAEMLARTSLKSLAFCPKAWDETLMTVFSQGLEGSKLTDLDLSDAWTSLSAASLEILMRTLPLTPIATLNLSGAFKKVKEAAQVLGRELTNTRLERVDFRHNPYDLPALETLIGATQKSTIVELKIDFSDFAQDAWRRLMALLEAKRRSDFVLQLRLQSQGSEDFTVRAHKMSGEIAASICCPRTILCDALPGLLLTELTSKGQLPAQSNALKLLLPNGKALEPSSALLLEQFEAERSREGPPAKKSRVGGL
jgi:hypothetical protein